MSDWKFCRRYLGYWMTQESGSHLDGLVIGLFRSTDLRGDRRSADTVGFIRLNAIRCNSVHCVDYRLGSCLLFLITYMKEGFPPPFCDTHPAPSRRIKSHPDPSRPIQSNPIRTISRPDRNSPQIQFRIRVLYLPVTANSHSQKEFPKSFQDHSPNIEIQ